MRHKVMVVDDDPFARKLLKQLLRNFPCNVVEASNGVEALTLIATDTPDLVLLDVNMPVLDGVQTLREIRSSSTHRDLPVVSISGYSEREMVMQLINLGISDFLVKPLRPDDAIRRLDAVFQSLRMVTRERHRARQVSGRRQKLLLVDGDPNFREFARPFLEPHFEVIEAATGAVGLQLFHQHDPRIICVAESLELLGAPTLVRLIRSASTQSAPRVFFMSDSADARHNEGAPGADVLRKSFVPEVFTRELRRTILANASPAATLACLVREELSDELVSATQQALGVLTSQEVSRLDAAEVAEVRPNLRTTVELASAGMKTTVRVAVDIRAEDAASIGRCILSAPDLSDPEATEAFSELVNAIAGRVCASLGEREFRLEQHPPCTGDIREPSETPSWELAIPFRTAEGERFYVAVWVEEMAQVATRDTAAEAPAAA